jgi:hypothetical protein
MKMGQQSNDNEDFFQKSTGFRFQSDTVWLAMDAKKMSYIQHGGKLPLAFNSLLLTCLAIYGYFFIMLTFYSCNQPTSNMEKSLLPSYGNGSYELTVFTDYFCHPCQALESELDPLLNQLIAEGGVKITFVDTPVNKLTPMYAKYFLYAVNASSDFREILHARNALFSIARTNVVSTEEGLELELRAQNVAFQPYDLSKVYPALNETIKNHDIRSTPTCVVKYSNADIRKYIGPEEIKRGLSLLLSAQRPVK